MRNIATGLARGSWRGDKGGMPTAGAAVAGLGALNQFLKNISTTQRPPTS